METKQCAECGIDFVSLESQKRKYHNTECYHKDKIGKTLSEEHKKKIRESNKGKKLSEETKRKIGFKSRLRTQKKDNPFFGKKHSEETKRLMKLNHPSKKVGYIHPFLGKKHKEETKFKASKTKKLLFKEGKIIPWNKGKYFRIEYDILYQKYIVEKKSAETIGKELGICGTIITRRLHKFGIPVRKGYSFNKERWQESKYREMNIKAIMKAQHRKPNQKEQLLNLVIKSITQDYIFVGDGGKFSNVEPVVINGRVPDFININGEKKAINFNGIYWHLWKKQKYNPNLTKEIIEETEKEPYKKLGWDLLIIWEDELKDKEIVMEKIQEFASL